MAEVVGHHHHLQTGEFSKVAAAICVADRLSRSSVRTWWGQRTRKASPSRPTP